MLLIYDLTAVCSSNLKHWTWSSKWALESKSNSEFGPALRRRLDQATSRDSFKPELLCDSMKLFSFTGLEKFLKSVAKINCFHCEQFLMEKR